MCRFCYAGCKISARAQRISPHSSTGAPHTACYVGTDRVVLNLKTERRQNIAKTGSGRHFIYSNGCSSNSNMNNSNRIDDVVLEAIKAASRPVNLIYRAALDNKAPTAVRASISNFVSELKARLFVLVTCVDLSWQNLSVLVCVGPEPVLARQPVCFAEWLKKRRFYRRRGAQRSRCGCSSSSTGADKSFLLSSSSRVGPEPVLANYISNKKKRRAASAHKQVLFRLIGKEPRPLHPDSGARARRGDRRRLLAAHTLPRV